MVYKFYIAYMALNIKHLNIKGMNVQLIASVLSGTKFHIF